jgi:transposase
MRSIGRRITECDQQIEKHLATFADNSNPVQQPSPKGEIKKKRKKPTQSAPAFDLRHELERISGVDLTRIDGIEVMVAQTVLSEVGLDMSRWKTEAHFFSWLELCPDNRISGDRVLRRGTRRVINCAATALRMAATMLLRSPIYLGAQYRRLRTMLGAPKAIIAMAHRLARLVYRMLQYGQPYADKGMDHYDQKYRDQQIQSLKKKAAKLGLQLMPALPS